MLPRRQFLNDPGTIVAQALEGLERANPGIVRWNREPSFVIRADDDERPHVAVISGGGSGHEPLHTGFVGRGMLDAAVPGGIFASPSMVQIAAATSAAAASCTSSRTTPATSSTSVSRAMRRSTRALRSRR